MTVYDHYADTAEGAYRGAGYTESHAGYDGPDEGAQAGMFTWLGGVASLALIAGLAMWSYDLVLRDVAGVPVIKAFEGPMRVQPENPGGSQADYQGLAVNQVQAAGIAADAPAQIMLAPRPLDLSDATPPSPQIAIVPEQPEITAPAVDDVQVVQAAYTPGAPEATTVPDTGLAVEALLSELVAEQDSASDVVPAALSDTVPDTVPGVRFSPRPVARPAEVRLASLVPPAEVPVAVAGFVDPATLTPGTRMVQFRAYNTEDDARTAWAGLSAEFGPYMTGKSPVILPSSDGASTFYRLRMIGFEDMAEAQRFCSVFLAVNRDCVPLQF